MFRYLFLSSTRLINRALKGVSFYFFPKWDLGHPPTLRIELSSSCNLSCPLCPVGDGNLDRGQEFMKFDTFKKIIDQANPRVISKILPDLWGESLLHPQYIEMLEYIKNTNNYYKVFATTNGNIDPERFDIKRLVNSGLTEIQVALDNDNQEDYVKYRKRGSVDKVLTFVKELHRHKVNEKSKMKINGLIIVSSLNENNIEGIKKSFGDYVDFFTTKQMRVFHDYEEKKSLLKEFFNFRPKREKNQYRPNKQKQGCMGVAAGIYVDAQSNIIACCADPKSRYTFGNIKTDNIFEVRKTEKFRNFQETIRERPETLPLCDTCMHDNF